MKKFGILCFVLLYIFCFISVSATEIADDTSIIGGCNTLDGQVPILGNQLIDGNMKSAVLYDVNSDSLMYTYNADEKLPPSSLLKILTALIAIEKGELSDAVTVQESVLATLDEDAAKVKLAIDEVVTVKDLIYCMMVASGNDAAIVLADHVLGSQQAFVTEMNRYAAELGCTNTNFTNVHGLHDENQYTTARDIARILAKAVENEEFCAAFGARYYTVPATNKSEERKLSSQNYLINNDDDVNYYDERVTGSRTAIANDRSRSIASVAELNDMKLICIVMGAGSKYEDDGYSVRVYGGYNETKKMLDLAFTGYKTAQLLFPNQILLQKTVMNGSSDVSVGTMDGAFSVIPENITDTGLTYRYVNEVPLSAPVEKGQRVSTLQIWYGNVCVAQNDLYAMNSVKHVNSLVDDNGKTQNSVGAVKVILIILGVFAGLVVVMFGALYFLRISRIAKVRRHRRRNSIYRRRSR